MEIAIITGQSGAGKSSALNIFEDMGYFCVDNLPPQLIESFLAVANKSSEPMTKIALGVDIRTREFFEDLRMILDQLKEDYEHVFILYLEASDEVLIRRYKEQRRPHPLDKMGNIYDGIQREKTILKPLRVRADLIIDTSDLTLGDLKRRLDDHYFHGRVADSFMVTVASFGYKYGILLDADLVFDLRFLPNPYYIHEFKKKTGLDKAVIEYVLSSKEASIFTDKLMDLLSFIIPLYIEEGKRNLVIGIGCTGGQHRSVVMAELIGQKLLNVVDNVKVYHREQSTWQTE